MLYYSKFKIGFLKRTFLIAKNEDGICSIAFTCDTRKFCTMLKNKYAYVPEYSLLKLKNEIKQIQDYFEGKRKSFALPLSLKGTDFQTKVWKAIARVPYGKTISYSGLAGNRGNKKALRAVGTACGNNPIPIIIPCHRVISKDGSIGGFTGGLFIKRKMLELEESRC